MKALLGLFVTVLFVGGLTQAIELGPDEETAWIDNAKKVADYAKDNTDKNCGKKIKYEFDKDSFGTELKDIKNAYNFMTAAIDGIDGICRKSEVHKKSVITKVDAIMMKKGDKTGFDWAGKTVNYVANLAVGTAEPRDALAKFVVTPQKK